MSIHKELGDAGVLEVTDEQVIDDVVISITEGAPAVKTVDDA